MNDFVLNKLTIKYRNNLSTNNNNNNKNRKKIEKTKQNKRNININIKTTKPNAKPVSEGNIINTPYEA